MNTKRNSFLIALTIVAFAVCITLIMASSSPDKGAISVPAAAVDVQIVPTIVSGTVVAQATTTTLVVTPTLEVTNRRHVLAGASLEQIGQYAVRHLAPGYLGPTGPIEVVLSRPVTRSEITELGLGCLAGGIPLEGDAPYVLVVLSGTFDFVGKRHRAQDTTLKYHYAAFVINVWAARPAKVVGGGARSQFSQALGEPTPIGYEPDFPTVCPTPQYTGLPHGAVIPGVVFPTTLPQPSATVSASTPTVPPPVGTTVATVPVP